MSNAFNASVVYYMEVLEYFDTKNYAWRFDIVQRLSCLIFGTFCSKIHIEK